MDHDLIDSNPRLKKPALIVLALFEHDSEPHRRTQIEADAAASWSNSFSHNPAQAINTLVHNGALVEQTYIDGKPYEGTLEDAQTDEAVPDDAQAWTTLARTPAGAQLYAAHLPQTTLHALLKEKPAYAEAFSALIWACSSEDGCSRAELESQLNALPALAPDTSTGRTRIYPQYFIDTLENAGGIEWRDGAWHATPAARELS